MKRASVADRRLLKFGVVRVALNTLLANYTDERRQWRRRWLSRYLELDANGAIPIVKAGNNHGRKLAV